MIADSQELKEGSQDQNKSEQEKVILDYDLLKRATLTLRAIRHPERKAILQAIHEAGSITVNDLCKKVNLKQSVTSLHLTILRATRIVDTKRDGRFMYYSINRSRIEQVTEAARQLAGNERSTDSLESLSTNLPIE